MTGIYVGRANPSTGVALKDNNVYSCAQGGITGATWAPAVYNNNAWDNGSNGTSNFTESRNTIR